MAEFYLTDIIYHFILEINLKFFQPQKFYTQLEARMLVESRLCLQTSHGYEPSVDSQSVTTQQHSVCKMSVTKVTGD